MSSTASSRLSFAWEETPDQLSAIQDVLADMQHSSPMDRLVCGDVGYGKTEVALRAAFKAAMDGKQVGGPRADHDPRPAALRDLPRASQGLPGHGRGALPLPHRQGAEGDPGAPQEGGYRHHHRHPPPAAEGRRVQGPRAGDHRRGAALRREAQGAPEGVPGRGGRDDPHRHADPAHPLHVDDGDPRPLDHRHPAGGPAGRQDLRRPLLRGADPRGGAARAAPGGPGVLRPQPGADHRRNGRSTLPQLVPEAKIAVGHGQMGEHELEKVMLGFMHGETNLLLCTTIIESGLDIPNANTLIVDRADTFGLSQLYQLRGRVGRSKQRAYAYLLIPGERLISADARERLKIIQELTELGAGFRIATHDLEIRGGGDLLGARQSGDIAAVGFELYTELLEEAIRQLKGEELAERVEPEIKLRIPAFIPEDYVKEPNQRLIIYKRLTQATTEDDVAEMTTELVDRFGKMPLAALYLVEVMKLRVALKAMLVKEIEFDGKRLILAFHQKTPVSPDKIIGLIRQQPKKYQFTPDFRLCAELSDTSFDGVLKESGNLLKTLG